MYYNANFAYIPQCTFLFNLCGLLIAGLSSILHPKGCNASDVVGWINSFKEVAWINNCYICNNTFKIIYQHIRNCVDYGEYAVKA